MLNLDQLSQQAGSAIDSLFADPTTRPGPGEGATPGMPGVQVTPSGPQGMNPLDLMRAHAADLHDPRAQVVQADHSLIGRITHKMTGDPSGYADLVAAGLNPQDIENARPGFWGSLFGPGGTPHQMYEAALDALLAQKQKTDALIQNHQILAQRAAALKANPAPPATASPEERRQWASSMLPLVPGDAQMIQSLMPLIADKKDLMTVAPGDLVIDYQGRPVAYNPSLKGTATASKDIFIDPDGNSHFGSEIPAGENIPKGWKPAAVYDTTVSQAGADRRFNAKQVDNELAAYTKSVAEFQPRADALNRAQTMIQNALDTNNPADYGPAVSQFVQAMDQDKNLRQAMMQYYSSHLDSSVRGQWNILRSRLTSGTVPAETLQKMLQAIQAMRELTNKQINSRRAAAIEQSQFPATLRVKLGDDTMGQYDMNSDTFGNPGPAAPTAKSAATTTPSTGKAAPAKTTGDAKTDKLIDDYIAGRKPKR